MLCLSSLYLVGFEVMLPIWYLLYLGFQLSSCKGNLLFQVSFMSLQVMICLWSPNVTLLVSNPPIIPCSVVLLSKLYYPYFSLSSAYNLCLFLHLHDMQILNCISRSVWLYHVFYLRVFTTCCIFFHLL